MARERKSAKQVRFLFSEGSPLTVKEKGKLASEIRSGMVTIEKQKRPVSRPTVKKRKK